MRAPLTTYRLQFHRGFRLVAARGLIAYLHDLGVTDLYASPLTAARPGSTHGYDVVDPSRLNPEIGSERALDALATTLRRRGMGLLLDIVPNHMAAAPENRWWLDVLANGRRSRWAGFFDIEWEQAPPAWRDKVVLPVLGRPYKDCLRSRDFRVERAGGDLRLLYGSLQLPLDVRSWSNVIRPALDAIAHRRGRRRTTLLRLSLALDRTEQGRTPRRSTDAAAEWWVCREKEVRAALATACRAAPAFRRALQVRIGRLNGRRGGPPGHKALERLLALQNYRLIHWRDAGALINYRRFFSINDLVCLRMEDRCVFAAWHDLVQRLVRAGQVHGLRIDHVDGMWDPALYLRRLRRACTHPLYTVVEKILVGREELRSGWPVAGTTGYDFLNMLNALFVEPRGASSLRRIYTRFTGDRRRFEDLDYRSKRRLLASDFKGQMRRLGEMFLQVIDPPTRREEVSKHQLVRALEVTTACMPVYRTYVDASGSARTDREMIRASLRAARRRAPRLPAAAFAAIERAFRALGGGSRPAGRAGDWQNFIMRWQQLTGPLMAKGHEDTALYIDHHLTSLNEVGGGPDAPGVSIAAFHRLMLNRYRRSPITMNATSTHDTKRGEDVRARINVLTEIPEEWSARLTEWHWLNRKARARVQGRHVPTPAEEVLIYQTLLGAWPADRREISGFGRRLKDYILKAAREAKEYTSWNDPDARHEEALQRFIDAILDPAASWKFLAGFRELQQPVARAGALNSLAQVVIKATAPGVPDFYQGSELWDLRLVDPDNRRPIDFALRRSLLARLQGEAARDRAALLCDLRAKWPDGRIKLYTTWRSLQLRRQQAELFLRGRYRSLEVAGHGADRVFAFARSLGSTWVMTVAPRFSASRIFRKEPVQGEAAWRSEAIRLPAAAPRTWRNVLTGGTVRSVAQGGAGLLALADVLDSFPVALLLGRPSRGERGTR